MGASPQSFFKLNCDTSVQLEKKQGDLGFIIRDSQGRCITAISEPCNAWDVLLNETLVVRQGMLEAISEEIDNLIIESDNQEVILALQTTSTPFPVLIRPIVEDIMYLQGCFESCTFLFIPRAKNAIVDALARRVLSLAKRTSWPISNPCLFEDGSVSRSFE
ncbi:uncharacterized protein LOC122650438 [Telopea speciosissima]|uniref:uncharacterized protein LOC122650438 n=1 Tax=Telopea speciosissima TaxID=54955 RepID=UPI001CC5E90F|nr:uncharacterized protein LOC122650438 [Telopea speciosissima]